MRIHLISVDASLQFLLHLSLEIKSRHGDISRNYGIKHVHLLTRLYGTCIHTYGDPLPNCQT